MKYLIILLLCIVFTTQAYGQLDNSTVSTITQNNTMIISQNMTIPTNMTIPPNMTEISIPLNTTEVSEVINEIGEILSNITTPDYPDYMYTVTSLTGFDIGTMEHILSDDEELEGNLNIRWEKADEVVIKSVRFNDFNDWFSLPVFPYELEVDDGIIDYKLSLPLPICQNIYDEECIEKNKYKIPAVITGTADGVGFTVETEIMVEVASFEYLDTLYFLLIPFLIIVIIIISRRRPKRGNFLDDLVKYK